MGLLRTLERFRATATSPTELAGIRDDLRQARRALLRAEPAAAWTHTQRAHDRSQNAPWLHTQAHALRVVGWALQARPGAFVRELPLVVMATPAAVVRRAAGIGPGQPGGVGLLATWRMRR
ncbi:DUF3703 domain-containing protein [Myxococcota bacterium]|nr:DUF3703 domain-containing protein [Myxococcota bacterium]